MVSKGDWTDGSVAQDVCKANFGRHGRQDVDLIQFNADARCGESRMKLGGTVATVGFPNIGLQGFAPKLAR